MKTFFMLHSINWPNFIFWLPLLEILGNMCIVIFECPVDDVINFEIKLSLPIRAIIEIFKNEKSWWNKRFFIIFKGSKLPEIYSDLGAGLENFNLLKCNGHAKLFHIALYITKKDRS